MIKNLKQISKLDHLLLSVTLLSKNLVNSQNHQHKHNIVSINTFITHISKNTKKVI